MDRNCVHSIVTHSYSFINLVINGSMQYQSLVPNLQMNYVLHTTVQNVALWQMVFAKIYLYYY